MMAYDIATHGESPNRYWGSVSLGFSTDDDRRWERTLNVARNPFDNSLYASIANSGTGKLLGYARVTRVDSRTITVEFPRRMLGKNVSKYRWVAESSFSRATEGTCGTNADGTTVEPCRDRLPDTGRLAHTLN